MSVVKGSSIHKTVWKILRILAGFFIRHKYNYSYDTVRPKSDNYIVLSNHSIDLDPIFIGLSFPNQMYFVASEHIFRLGFLSKLLNIFFAPIQRLKGKSEIGTVKAMLKLLKAGENVCIFPEGVCTFDGTTQPFAPAIGKLVKKSGAGMITYTVKGAYYAKPRWAKRFRKSEIKGCFVKEYTPECLSGMTDNEINEAIKKDLYVNAYEYEATKKYTSYIPDNAENIEYALYACPECGGIASITSDGDTIICKNCKKELKLTPQLEIVNTDGSLYKFSRIYLWSEWQRSHLEEYIKKSLKSNVSLPILEDDGQELYEYERGKKNRLRDRGILRLYTDRLEFEGIESKHIFLANKLSYIDIHGKSTILFTYENKNYEIKTEKIRSSLKYEDAFRIIKRLKAEKQSAL